MFSSSFISLIFSPPSDPSVFSVWSTEASKMSHQHTLPVTVPAVVQGPLKTVCSPDHIQQEQAKQPTPCGGNAGTQTQLVLALANILSLSLTSAFSLPRVHKRVKWLSIYKTGILEGSILPCPFLISLFFLYALLFNVFISIFLQIGLYYSKLQT